jgi:acetyl esterase/lipase
VGGNLTLMLSAWARDQGLRSMDAVVAFSPATDSTLASPSTRSNIDTDPLLGPGLGPLARLPGPVRALLASMMGMLNPPLARLPGPVRALLASMMGMLNPRNPLMSPLVGDLSNLPPTLVQASDCEMLFDDSLRYVNKATALGSPATLQVWPGMVHVWPMFQHVLPEARHAIDEVAAFLSANSSAARMKKAADG